MIIPYEFSPKTNETIPTIVVNRKFVVFEMPLQQTNKPKDEYPDDYTA